MKKREQEFLSDFKRSIERDYPSWDYYKISDGGQRFSLEKPCDSLLHITKNKKVFYYPLEAKSVKGASRFDISKIEKHQWKYLSRYSNLDNADSFFIVHYDIPRLSFFVVYSYKEMKQLQSTQKSIPYEWVVKNKRMNYKYREVIEGERKSFYDVKILGELV